MYFRVVLRLAWIPDSLIIFWKASISLVENHRLAKGAGLVEVLECTLMIGQKGLGESGGVSRCSPD